MSDRPDPAAIARGLSKAQCRAIRRHRNRAADCAHGTFRTLSVLHRLGIVENTGARWAAPLTTLGYEVRESLAALESADAGACPPLAGGVG